MRISTAASSKDAFPGVAPEIKFAGDSLLEGDGFELPVPQQIRSRFRIGASDDGKCFPVESDQGAQLRIGTSGRERSLTMKSGIGDVGLRKAKICIAVLDASD